METEKFKKQFILEEIISASLSGALQTRGARIYKPDADEEQRKEIRKFLRSKLRDEFLKEYKDHVANDEQHFDNIKKFADEVSKHYKNLLIDGRFRIGITQKLLNLYLKYLWALHLIPEPSPNCPFDSIAVSKIKNAKYVWTKSDKIEEYKELVHMARKQIGEGQSLAEWELRMFESGRPNRA